MFHTPDYYHNVSMKLSEVLEDIGVNENMVLERRRTTLLKQTMVTIINKVSGKQLTVYNVGSRLEGTTTEGLKSDYDKLFCLDNLNVIQDWSEWTPGKINYLMIQNETTPPQFCLLQRLRDDAPLPATQEYVNHFVTDTSGRILCKNTIIDAVMPEGRRRQGPSLASIVQPGFLGNDLVAALPCKSWPQSTRAWLNHQGIHKWPTKEMKRYCQTTRGFIVGVGNKASENKELEWRISTSLPERCLMFNLNITQVRCYVIMKMILKSYINLRNEKHISSFMCKTVLFHCIKNTHSNIWKECYILNCLSYCLFTLNSCISNGNCPHFIVHGNNLMAGKISTEDKLKLLQRMSNLIPCDGISLSGIQIDNLGERLQVKLNMINEAHHDFLKSDEYTAKTAGVLLQGLARQISENHNTLFHTTKKRSLEITSKFLLHLTRYYRNGNMLEKAACRLLAPLFCTSIGSLIASYNIQTNNTVSPRALAWLEAGLDSDVASSRLKLASIMYCTGDMERAALVLNDVEEQYEREVTEPVCGCQNLPIRYNKKRFGQLSSQHDENAVTNIVAFCVNFIPKEINCVPHELRYEMFRSTQEDLLHRGRDDDWMDCAVVDSLPYIYFLQYKTYGNLQRPEEQQHALNKLVRVIGTERNFAHKETALNLLGQCMEQENPLVDALKCYMLSLHHRERNNAAKILIGRCLATFFSVSQF